jgi:hypothetical protein
LLLAEFHFRSVSADVHPHIVGSVLSAFGINRILAAAIEAGADTLAAKQRVILHISIVPDWAVFTD